MKKFKSLNLTYERLTNEVEMLTTKSIQANGEYNTINTKLKESKEQLLSIKDKIKVEIHKSKAEIVNFNKSYKKEIEDKAEIVNNLQKRLKEKESVLETIDKTLDKKKIELDTTELKLSTLKGQLDTKSNKLNRYEKEISENYAKMKLEEDKWGKDIKEKKAKSNELFKSIVSIRQEEKQSKEEYELRKKEISQQKKVLILWEDRLKEKEIKIQSDMKTLISAKQHIKGVNHY